MTKGQKAAARHAQNNAKNALKRIRRRERMRQEDPGAAVAPRHRRGVDKLMAFGFHAPLPLPGDYPGDYPPDDLYLDQLGRLPLAHPPGFRPLAHKRPFLSPPAGRMAPSPELARRPCASSQEATRAQAAQPARERTPLRASSPAFVPRSAGSPGPCRRGGAQEPLALGSLRPRASAGIATPEGLRAKPTGCSGAAAADRAGGGTEAPAPAAVLFAESYPDLLGAAAQKAPARPPLRRGLFEACGRVLWEEGEEQQDFSYFADMDEWMRRVVPSIASADAPAAAP